MVISLDDILPSDTMPNHVAEEVVRRAELDGVYRDQLLDAVDTAAAYSNRLGIS